MDPVVMRATYERLWYESDEPDTEPTREGGFTDPNNPWGGFRQELPEHFNPGPQWYEENVKTVEFDNLWEAAEFVVEFPGGVWDFCEGEYSTVDYRHGIEMQVTLHVQNHKEGVFAIAEFLQAQQDKHLSALRERDRARG